MKRILLLLVSLFSFLEGYSVGPKPEIWRFKKEFDINKGTDTYHFYVGEIVQATLSNDQSKIKFKVGENIEIEASDNELEKIPIDSLFDVETLKAPWKVDKDFNLTVDGKKHTFNKGDFLTISNIDSNSITLKKGEQGEEIPIIKTTDHWLYGLIVGLLAGSGIAIGVYFAVKRLANKKVIGVEDDFIWEKYTQGSLRGFIEDNLMDDMIERLIELNPEIIPEDYLQKKKSEQDQYYTENIRKKEIKIDEKTPPTLKIVNSQSLSQFAFDYLMKWALQLLSKLNKGVNDIPEDYFECGNGRKKEINEDLRNKLLIVKLKTQQNSDVAKVEVPQKATDGHSKLESDLEKILNYLKKISEEQKTVSENQSLTLAKILGSVKPTDTSELDRLNKETAHYKAASEKTQKAFEELSSTNQDLLLELSIKSEKDNLLIDLQNSVTSASYLKEYCRDILDYFVLCDKVILEAYQLWGSINKNDAKEAMVPANLLLNFHESVKLLPKGKWIQISKDISETGYTSAREIKDIFKRPDNDFQKKEDFQKIFYKQVLIDYSSSILILAEAFRNLNKFPIKPTLVHDSEGLFSKYVEDLQHQIEPTGLKNNYIPLFTNWKYQEVNVSNSDKGRRMPYILLTGLERGDIVEIVSYGVSYSIDNEKKISTPTNFIQI